MDRGGGWIKWAMLLLGVVALAGVASVLLDSSLGPTDDAHRTRHAAGFSIALPTGWGASTYPESVDGETTMRLSPERVTGRSPIIAVSKLRSPPPIDPRAVPRDFQGRPAFLLTEKRKYNWSWALFFDRGGTWYSIILANPIEVDLFNSPFGPFIESFRVDPRSAEPNAPAATDPATRPAAGR